MCVKVTGVKMRVTSYSERVKRTKKTKKKNKTRQACLRGQFNKRHILLRIAWEGREKKRNTFFRNHKGADQLTLLWSDDVKQLLRVLEHQLKFELRIIELVLPTPSYNLLI